MTSQALGLLRIGEQGERLGLIVGGVTSAMLLALNIKRSFDTCEHFLIFSLPDPTLVDIEVQR